MIKNKKWFYLALFLFIVSIILNFPFPHDNPYGETVFSLFSIPISSGSGLRYIGLTSLILLLASLLFLAKSLEKYKGRFVLLAIVIATASPSLIAELFQKTFATGIYAVSYEREFSRCSFEMINDTTLHVECELPFENYSRHDAQFTVQFNEKSNFDDATRAVSLMNENGPYEVKLKGNERKIVKIDTNIDVSNRASHIESGRFELLDIIIKSSAKSRNL